MIDEGLAAAGLQLQGSMAVEAVSSRVEGCGDLLASFSTVLVFAHAGTRFWRNLPHKNGTDPLDDHAVQLVSDWLDSSGVQDYRLLYPSTDVAFDLRELGRCLGWHHDSPLGIGLHPIFGTWFAYRVVVAANLELEPEALSGVEAPCMTCADQPCVAACPANAVSSKAAFDLDACSAFRLRPGSVCATRCLAREACPVGTMYRYDEDQVEYHYAHSLDALKAFSAHGE